MPFDAAGIFREQFALAIAADVERSGMAVEDWMWAGTTKPQTFLDQWNAEKGPACVQAFIDWFEASDYEVWVAPDGRPAIELELEVEFGAVRVLMFIDLILVSSSGLLVVDLKSGSTGPDGMKRVKSRQQLGIYASGVELAYGSAYRPLWGAHFMAQGFGPKDGPKQYLQAPFPLSEYRFSVPFFTRELETFDRAAEAGIFPAVVGPGCDRCGVASACTAVGGSAAWLHDPADPNYEEHRNNDSTRRGTVLSVV